MIASRKLPHEIGNGTTTRSPTSRFVTPLPFSTTSPMNSCPSTSPFFIVGTLTVDEVQARTADRGRRDPDDRVAVVQNRRIGHVLDAHVVPAHPARRTHRTA